MMLTNKKVKKWLKKIFLRIVRRGVHYSSEHKKIDRIYMVDDPWCMDSHIEEYRFAETNRLILEKFGKVEKLLEIGCGEGHQSIWLQMVCDNLVGVDVSKRAVDRARKRCLGGQFMVSDILGQAVRSKALYDLVTACEVLYYISDVSLALRQISELGSIIIVTYLEREMEKLDPQVLSWPGVNSEILENEYARWRVAWWRSKRS